MKPIIRVENLSKQYVIGARRTPYRTLRDSITEALRSPFMRFKQDRNSEENKIWALKDVSLDIKPGEVVGLIGRNGAGKSTLLKILSRITEPTTGEAKLYGRLGSLLEVGTGFHAELSGRENIFLNGAILGMRRREIERKFDEIVAFAEIEKFLNTPVKHYSSGMYVRLAFAVAAHLQPDILLVDEVLAVGDAAFQKRCLGKMNEVASEGRTVVFVSHNMGMISHLCNRGTVLSGGRVVFDGRATEAVEFYNHSLLETNGSRNGAPPHVIFQASPEDEKRDFVITKIEILDLDGKPKPLVSTWDDFVVRYHFVCKRKVQRGAVILHLYTFDGSRVLVLSTQPDGTLPLEFSVGEHCVECVIEQLPLAAGEYTVTAGLEIPQTDSLFWRHGLGKLVVTPRDVYGSGMAPVATRSLLAVEHSWRSRSK
ncbi:MAG: ABC transporter ATP-binding protein [Blastocatellales bacterium]